MSQHTDAMIAFLVSERVLEVETEEYVEYVTDADGNTVGNGLARAKRYKTHWEFDKWLSVREEHKNLDRVYIQ